MQEPYVNALKTEIALKSKEVRNKTVDSIFIGGGTPSTLYDGGISDILAEVRKNFNVLADAEISIEANPNSVTNKKALEYKRAGITRVSVGLQSASDNILKAMNRPHDKQDFVDTIKMLRKAGFENINSDLLLGFPGQTIGDIEDSVSFLIDMDIPHISAYGLIVEKGTPLYRSIKKKTLQAVSEEQATKMYDYVYKTFKDKGIARYEVSNFSKEGFECKHNLKYWNLIEYLGLGLASHSYVGEKREANTENLESYIEKLSQNKTPVEFKEELDLEQKQLEYVMLSLRKEEGLDLEYYKNELNCDLLKEKEDEIEFLKEKDFIKIKNNMLTVTDKGFNVLNSIIVRLT